MFQNENTRLHGKYNKLLLIQHSLLILYKFVALSKLRANFYGKNLFIVAQFHQRSTYSFYACRSQKRKKIQLSHKYLFMLLGSTGAKAVRRTLMKLTPGANFSNALSTPFTYESVLRIFSLATFWL